MTSYATGDSYILQEYRDGSTGLRPSHAKLLALIDTSDPAWPITASILREMADAGAEIDATACALAAKMGAKRMAAAESNRHADRRTPAYRITLASASSIVYYVLRSDLIKIGTTVDPKRRFSALLPEAILAYEPGALPEERFRHRQFDHLRCGGENFRQAPELLEHIRQTRQMYGDPDPEWPTLAAYRNRKDRTPAGSAINDYEGELLPAAELRVRLGIKTSTFRAWVTHGRLAIAGHNDRGHQLFSADRASALAAGYAARIARRAG